MEAEDAMEEEDVEVCSPTSGPDHHFQKIPSATPPSCVDEMIRRRILRCFPVLWFNCGERVYQNRFEAGYMSQQVDVGQEWLYDFLNQLERIVQE